MKILYFTKYSRNAGSSRLRSYQYFPYLESAGFQVAVSPLFSEKYLQKLYAGKSTKMEAVKGYLNRFFALFSVFNYDKIVIEKELFPYLPAWTERILEFLGVKYIADYDDAIFHNYDRSDNRWVKSFLSLKIDKVMRYSACVVAGNTYLAERARKAGATRIEIIPTVIDLERYPEKEYVNKGEFVVGWIGTKSTFEKHFMQLADQVQELTHTYTDLYFHIVGAPDNGLFNQQVRFIPWTEESEVAEIMKFDIGLMPLIDSDWEKGKCAYKLIQYMACGIPGLASAVGANVEVVNSENGFLVNDLTDFETIIKEIRLNRMTLKEKGRRARQNVLNKYTLQVQQYRLSNILRDETA